MQKYMFFDFNGTILNDVDLCLELLNNILTKQNKPLVTKEQYKELFTFPIKKYYELAGIDFNLNSFEELSLDFIKEYQPRSFKCSLFPNLISTVNELKRRGYVVGVLSASEINNLTEQLTVLGIKDNFDFILGLSDIYAKSKVEVALNFIKENNLSEAELYFVGDTCHDLEVANSIGASCYLFDQGHQSYNVLKKTNNPIISDISELLNYLK